MKPYSLYPANLSDHLCFFREIISFPSISSSVFHAKRSKKGTRCLPTQRENSILAFAAPPHSTANRTVASTEWLGFSPVGSGTYRTSGILIVSFALLLSLFLNRIYPSKGDFSSSSEKNVIWNKREIEKFLRNFHWFLFLS